MKRSAGVTTIAILSLIGSAFVLLLGVLVALVALLAPVHSARELPHSTAFFKVIFWSLAIFHALLAAWGILTSIGLFRLKKWARISTIVFSVLLLLQSAFGLLLSLVIPFLPRRTQSLEPATLPTMSMFIGIISLTLLGLGIWWLTFFLRKNVNEQFASARTALPFLPMTEGASQTPGTSAIFSLPRPAKRPLSFTIIACYVLVGGFSALVSLLSRSSATLFINILIGWPATIYYIALLMLQLYIGIGLLRLHLTARIVAIAYFCFRVASGAIFYLAPGGHSRILDLMQRSREIVARRHPLQIQRPPIFDPTPFMVIVICISLAVTLISIYFLITRKAAFEKAAAAR